MKAILLISLVSAIQKYDNLGDKNFDTVEKHAQKFSDAVNGITRMPEESWE